MSDDDRGSVGSAGSAATVKRDCPVCKKEFTTRSLFNHIKTKHHSHWFESMYANEKMLNGYIEKCEPVPFMYEEKNDFDEVECKDIYGCLACNNTFTCKVRGATHCSKVKCKAAHIKETKALLQRVIDLKTKIQNEPAFKKWSREQTCLQIETLMRWYKWIKQSGYWKTLYDYYTPERERMVASGVVEKAKYNFDWVHNTPDGAWCRIPYIPEYELSYNKDAKDLLFYYHLWAGIVDTLHYQFTFMRWHYASRHDEALYYEYHSDYHPNGLYIHPHNAEFNLHKLPEL